MCECPVEQEDWLQPPEEEPAPPEPVSVLSTYEKVARELLKHIERKNNPAVSVAGIDITDEGITVVHARSSGGSMRGASPTHIIVDEVQQISREAKWRSSNTKHNVVYDEDGNKDRSPDGVMQAVDDYNRRWRDAMQ